MSKTQYTELPPEICHSTGKSGSKKKKYRGHRFDVSFTKALGPKVGENRRKVASML